MCFNVRVRTTGLKCAENVLMKIITFIMVNCSMVVKVKVKQALRVVGGWGSKILGQSAHEGYRVVSPKHRPPLFPGNISVTHFCYRLSRPQGHSAAGRIMSMKNSSDTIGNRPRDLPVCSAEPQTLSNRVPLNLYTGKKNIELGII
jgi:hypothetical protein